MRKVVYSLTNSLDNFIARDDGSADWIQMGDEIMQGFSKLSETFDTVLSDASRTTSPGLKAWRQAARQPDLWA